MPECGFNQLHYDVHLPSLSRTVLYSEFITPLSIIILSTKLLLSLLSVFMLYCLLQFVKMIVPWIFQLFCSFCMLSITFFTFPAVATPEEDEYVAKFGSMYTCTVCLMCLFRYWCEYLYQWLDDKFRPGQIHSNYSHPNILFSHRPSFLCWNLGDL